MPTRTRMTTGPTTGPATGPTASGRTMSGEVMHDASATVQGAAQDVAANFPRAGVDTVEVGRQTGSTTAQVLRAPGSAVRTLVDDLAGAARRPDAVLSWAALAGLVAVGVLEAPVAAAVGVGIAVAGGVRRVRG